MGFCLPGLTRWTQLILFWRSNWKYWCLELQFIPEHMRLLWRGAAALLETHLLFTLPCAHEFPRLISDRIEVTEQRLDLLSSMRCSCWAITADPTESEVSTVQKTANMGRLQWMQLERHRSALERGETPREGEMVYGYLWTILPWFKLCPNKVLWSVAPLLFSIRL